MSAQKARKKRASEGKDTLSRVRPPVYPSSVVARCARVKRIDIIDLFNNLYIIIFLKNIYSYSF